MHVDYIWYMCCLMWWLVAVASTLVSNSITPRVASSCRSWSGRFGSSWCEKTTDDKYLYFAYDATYLYAYAFKNLINMGAPISGPNILTQLRNVTFTGKTTHTGTYTYIYIVYRASKSVTSARSRRGREAYNMNTLHKPTTAVAHPV